MSVTTMPQTYLMINLVKTQLHSCLVKVDFHNFQVSSHLMMFLDFLNDFFFKLDQNKHKTSYGEVKTYIIFCHHYVYT